MGLDKGVERPQRGYSAQQSSTLLDSPPAKCDCSWYVTLVFCMSSFPSSQAAFKQLLPVTQLLLSLNLTEEMKAHILYEVYKK